MPEFKKRLTDVERWRLGEGSGGSGDDDGEEGVVWGGVGCHVSWQMPSQRSFLKNVVQMDDWLRERGMWIPGMRHGMDALEHACVLARKMGAEIHVKPEKLWESGGKTDGKRVTAKSAIRPHPSGSVH